MCLTRVTKRINNPTSEEVTAYKIFRRYPWGLDFQYIINYKQQQTNTWLKATSLTLTTSNLSGVGDTQEYPSGFHCYKTKEDAMLHLSGIKDYDYIVEVRVRYVHTHGDQWYDNTVPCLVAREMYIPQENLPVFDSVSTREE